MCVCEIPCLLLFSTRITLLILGQYTKTKQGIRLTCIYEYIIISIIINIKLGLLYINLV